MLNRTQRLALGRWFYFYRSYGLFPLIALGMFAETGMLPVHRGRFMMLAGAVGVLFGSLLRVVCYTFVGTHGAQRQAEPGTLVTTGPYAVSRNPVYLAEVAIALGIAMMSRIPWLVLLSLGACVFLFATIIEWEEDALRRRFQGAYEAYLAAVPRWFSLSRLFHKDSFRLTRGAVKLLPAVRSESRTLLICLLTILAFLTKADIEQLF